LIIIAALVILVVVWLVFFFNKSEEITNTSNQAATNSQAFKVEFLSNAEKTSLSIPTDLKIQSIKRGASGELLIYKIINNDAEIVTDPAEVGPISPRDKNRLK